MLTPCTAYPSYSCINADEDNTFGFQYFGDKLEYCLVFVQNADDVMDIPVYDIYNFTEGVYNGDFAKFQVDSGTLTNGCNYKWRVYVFSSDHDMCVNSFSTATRNYINSVLDGTTPTVDNCFKDFDGNVITNKKQLIPIYSGTKISDDTNDVAFSVSSDAERYVKVEGKFYKIIGHYQNETDEMMYGDEYTEVLITEACDSIVAKNTVIGIYQNYCQSQLFYFEARAIPSGISESFAELDSFSGALKLELTDDTENASKVMKSSVSVSVDGFNVYKGKEQYKNGVIDTVYLYPYEYDVTIAYEDNWHRKFTSTKKITIEDSSTRTAPTIEAEQTDVGITATISNLYEGNKYVLFKRIGTTPYRKCCEFTASDTEYTHIDMYVNNGNAYSYACIGVNSDDLYNTLVGAMSYSVTYVQEYPTLVCIDTLNAIEMQINHTTERTVNRDSNTVKTNLQYPSVVYGNTNYLSGKEKFVLGNLNTYGTISNNNVYDFMNFVNQKCTYILRDMQGLSKRVKITNCSISELETKHFNTTLYEVSFEWVLVENLEEIGGV